MTTASMTNSKNREKPPFNHSKSTPDFSTLKEEEAPWTSRHLPPMPPISKLPTFTPSIPSEPASEDEESIQSASSFERELLSRTATDTESSTGSEDEHEGEGEGEHGSSNATSALPTRVSHTRLHQTISSAAPPTRPLYNHTSRSQSYVGPSAFAPPFYNRPPTPLPPSPSLTSLLRPRPFSALPSRPTTPDSSDTEATGTTHGAGFSTTTLSAAAVAQSALTATDVPRASPKVPTYEYYGFVLYLGSSIAFFLYLLWSYLPTPFLHQLGIYYYPDRWWSLAVPAWLVAAVCYIYIALASWNTGVMTLGLRSLDCLVDEKGRIAVVDAKGRIVREDRHGSGHRHRHGGKSKKGGQSKGKSPGHRRASKEGGYGRLGMVGQKGDEVRDLDWGALWNEGTDAVMDVPIGGVCQVLYGTSRFREDLDGNGEG